MDVFDYKQFANKEDLLSFIKENKDTLISQKKAVFKEADGFMGNVPVISKSSVNKSDDSKELIKHIIINTTNILDSHGDVHIKGIWDRSLQHDNKKLHLQEHKRGFDDIIATKKDVEAYTLNTTFKELGYDIEGDTQALIFKSIIRKEKNTAMYERYKNGEVDNHSVGMQYVKMVMAIDSDESWASAEKEVWDKYYPIIANKEDANERGYFWVIKEAKVIEGSAVTIGSNPITGIYKSEYKSESAEATHKEIKETVNTTPTIKDFINLLNKQS